MYWQVMRRGAERGCKFFDFGRSKVGTGPYHFKKNWGFEPRAITHQYYLREGQEITARQSHQPKISCVHCTVAAPAATRCERLGPLSD